MPGAVLIETFNDDFIQQNQIDFIPSYETDILSRTEETYKVENFEKIKERLELLGYL